MSSEFREIFAELDALQATLVEQFNSDVQLNKEMNSNLQAIEKMVVGTISAFVLQIVFQASPNLTTFRMQRTLKLACFSNSKATL